MLTQESMEDHSERVSSGRDEVVAPINQRQLWLVACTDLHRSHQSTFQQGLERGS